MNEEVKCPRMVTIQEAAKNTGLSYNYIRNLCINKQIIFVKAGCKYLVNLDKFIDFLNGEGGETV